MKKNGFTLIELIVIICIIALLLAILVPAILKTKEYAEEIAAKQKAEAEVTIVVMKTNVVLVKVDVACKIELKPAFSGPNVEIYLSKTPGDSEIVVENGKYYLLWTPQKANTFKTTLITAAAHLKEEKEITILVRR